MGEMQQMPLFDFDPDLYPVEVEEEQSKLTPQSTLTEATAVYLDDLQFSGASIHTVKAFRSDLNLLTSWVGEDKAVGKIALTDLNRFLHWMLHERDIPCSPKTYARRVTSLKHFFGYLHEMHFLPDNPAAGVVQKSVTAPLPMILLPDEVEKVLKITENLRKGGTKKPDIRPHFLVNLILQTGIKKAECMNLTPDHFDRKHADGPFLWIRYDNPRMRYKERKIKIEPDLLPLLDEYLRQRQPSRVVFDCTPRNLEYVLRDVAQIAGYETRKLSFETLRWTSAVTDYLNDMEPDKLRRKMGLSRISWRETGTKLQELAEVVEAESVKSNG